MPLITLYRPIGTKELELIESSQMRRFPPRLSWQPIFYPVLNEQYAIDIASRWNIEDEGSGFAGFVTAFDIPEAYFQSFEIQNVGDRHHNELWVPAEQMEEFNDQISGEIRVLRAFYGKQYTGEKRY